ncbi:MAG: hypothetical protein ACI3YD_01820 [Alloprevotella sp.]
MSKPLMAAAMGCMAMAWTGCSDDHFEQQPSNPQPQPLYHTVVLESVMNQQEGDAQSRTVIESSGNGYYAKWSVGDVIDFFEYAEGVPVSGTSEEGDPVTTYVNQEGKYVSAALEESDISLGKASFQVNLAAANQGGTAYTYVAVYPHMSYGAGDPYESSMSVNEWVSESDDSYKWWKEDWGYSGPYVAPHPVVMVLMPYEQSPTAGSFDPKADLMVSKLKRTDAQLTDSEPLTFARFGSVIKITAKGLDAYQGQTVSSARFSFDESYGGNLNAEYDTALERLKYYKGYQEFVLTPKNVTVKEDGTVDLWIRAYAGEITGWFRLDLTLKDGSDTETPMARKVDLQTAGKSLKFEEGRMTAFGVTNLGVADVEPVSGENITHQVNETADGFTVAWTGVENAQGYECWYYTVEDYVQSADVALTPQCTDEGANTWQVTASGLAPDVYYVTVRPVPAGGHAMKSGVEETACEQVYVGVAREYYISLCDLTTQTIGESGAELDFTSSGFKAMGFNMSVRSCNWLYAVNGQTFKFYTTEVPWRRLGKLRFYADSEATVRKLKVYATNNALGSTDDATELDAPTVTAYSSYVVAEYEVPVGKDYKHFYMEGDYRDNDGVGLLSISGMSVYGYE